MVAIMRNSLSFPFIRNSINQQAKFTATSQTCAWGHRSIVPSIIVPFSSQSLCENAVKIEWKISRKCMWNEAMTNIFLYSTDISSRNIRCGCKFPWREHTVTFFFVQGISAFPFFSFDCEDMFLNIFCLTYGKQCHNQARSSA